MCAGLKELEVWVYVHVYDTEYLVPRDIVARFAVRVKQGHRTMEGNICRRLLYMKIALKDEIYF